MQKRYGFGFYIDGRSVQYHVYEATFTVEGKETNQVSTFVATEPDGTRHEITIEHRITPVE